MPATRPPSMSVSSRSPIINGRRAPTRCTDAFTSAGAGLPATCGSRPDAMRTAVTIEPLPGSGPRSVGRVGSRLQATQTAPARSATVASARFRQPVSGLWPCTTATASSARGGHRQPDAGDLGGQRVRADDEHRGARRELLGEHGRRRLGAGDDVGFGGGEAELGEVRRDVGRAARGVVGDEDGADASRRRPADRLDRTRHRHRAAVEGAVEVGEQEVVAVEEIAHRGSASPRAATAAASDLAAPFDGVEPGSAASTWPFVTAAGSGRSSGSPASVSSRSSTA